MMLQSNTVRRKSFARDAGHMLLLAFFIDALLEMLDALSVFRGLAVLCCHPVATGYNTLIIFCTLLPALLLRRRRFGWVLVTSLWGVLGIANCVMRVLRISPLGFYDFVMFVRNFSIVNSYVTVGEVVLLVLLLVLLVVGLVVLFRHSPRVVPQRRPAALLWLAALALTAACTVPYSLVCCDYLDPVKGYKSYGFAYSLLRSAVDRGIDRPEEYDRTRIKQILTAVEGDTPDTAQQTPNFIFVQLESFVDPANFTAIRCSENPVPTFTHLKETCPGGLLYVPMIGGGTANVEFEVLTGMDVTDFGTGEYPYSTVLQNNVCESVAQDLKRLGYMTHALHSNTGTFYQRHLVFSALGFDTFTPLEYMPRYTLNELGWCKDASLTEYIMAMLAAEEKRDLIFAVTVQGHGKYPTDAPETPYPITVTGTEDPTLQNELSYYVNQLKETDDFLAQLLAALQAYDEPVVLVVYGDHLPALNIEEEDLKTGSLLATEYVIWSNEEALPCEQKDLRAFQLTAYTLGRYGISNGVLMRFHQQCAGNENYLDELQSLEYDMLYGDRYLYDGETPYERAQTRMGILPLRLDSALYDERALVAYGENFTRSSVLCAQGRQLDTIYIDENTLAALPGLLSGVEAGDTICVCQVATDGTVLGESNAVICQQR